MGGDVTEHQDFEVVLLCDGEWPNVPGVCCWRSGVRNAFGAAGATVREVVWQPPAPAPVRKATTGNGPRRLAWLPPFARRPLAQAYRRLRRATAEVRLGRGHPGPIGSDQGAPDPNRPDLDGADLVVAESLRAARAAASADTPSYRVWALALPPQWLPPGGHTEYATELNETAKQVGGFLTDGELARESIERSAHALRPKVELFPPIATDQACEACTGQPVEPLNLTELDPTVAQLALWRDGHAEEDEPHPYSFAGARQRGLAGPWAKANRSAWQNDHTGTPMTMPGDRPADWTAAAQAAGARAVRDTVRMPGPTAPRQRRNVMVSGHDLKFAVELAERLDRRSDLDLSIDEWPGLARQTAQTAERLERADSILAEWARTSAIWLSEHKRPDQFLVVRLHRFELDTPYPRQLALENVDAVVYIAPLFGRRIRDELNWPTDKLVYIPNYLDLDWLDRPKLDGAQFTLGFVGFEFIRKRFDLALDLLAEIRQTDKRFRMVVRGAMPWHNKYAWTNDDERDYVGWCFERIERDPLLRDAVVLHPPGRDMARWFRRVGYLVSTSDEEGSHASVAEGMASGAVPVVRSWPGAAEIYGKQWVHDSIGAAANAVLSNADPAVSAESRDQAREEIGRTHDPHKVVAAWADLLHRDVAGARRYFAEYASVELPDSGR
ncbi:glycosyltransferase family 4 protein [Tenggerimyces flavus]|uniref:Glycosyltransferase family 4 protein n=1 Tax=Tenggerimyces flavus TaxID=1708749 RepID=A0ABV7YGP7_9ACTN|nr:glycosyltransferase family 4 protein [Tenggerimyces flavus]MBM7789831.1 glycosyltransferase involved in cell wall biosynthesis [Tenggerimyces flavus]